MENSVCEFAKMVENWLINPRNSFTMFNVNLIIIHLVSIHFMTYINSVSIHFEVWIAAAIHTSKWIETRWFYIKHPGIASQIKAFSSLWRIIPIFIWWILFKICRVVRKWDDGAWRVKTYTSDWGVLLPPLCVNAVYVVLWLPILGDIHGTGPPSNIIHGCQ